MFNLFKSKLDKEAERIIQFGQVLVTASFETILDQSPEFEAEFKKQKLTFKNWVYSVSISSVGVTSNTARSFLPSKKLKRMDYSLRSQLIKLNSRGGDDMIEFTMFYLPRFTKDSDSFRRVVGQSVLAGLWGWDLNKGVFTKFQNSNVTELIGSPISTEFYPWWHSSEI